MSLRDKLNEISRRSQESIPGRVLEVIRRQMNDLEEADILSDPDKVPPRMPDSELFDTENNPVYLRGFWITGPLVVSFYRGGW